MLKLSFRPTTDILTRSLILLVLGGTFSEGCKHPPNAKERRGTIARVLQQPKEAVAAKKTDNIQPWLTREVATATNEEKLAHARIMAANMRLVLEKAQQVKADAEREGDIVKLNCINEKLMQIRERRAIFKRAFRQMLGAIVTNEMDVVNHQFTKMLGAHERVAGNDFDSLKSEVDYCVSSGMPIPPDAEYEVSVEQEGVSGCLDGFRIVDPTERAAYVKECRALERKLSDAYTNTDASPQRMGCIAQVERRRRPTLKDVRDADHALAMCRLSHPSFPSSFPW